MALCEEGLGGEGVTYKDVLKGSLVACAALLWAYVVVREEIDTNVGAIVLLLALAFLIEIFTQRK